eukprot:11157518-Lingulodinium_polyedra.AAC.1
MCGNAKTCFTRVVKSPATRNNSFRTYFLRGCSSKYPSPANATCNACHGPARSRMVLPRRS